VCDALAFWRAGEHKAGNENTVAQPVVSTPASAESGDLDLRALGQALVRNKGWIIIPTLLAAVLSIAAVNLITPRYKSEARILIDGRENVFLRPNGERNEERNALDAEAVTSQVQLLLSRDLARDIIRKKQARRAAGIRPGAGRHFAGQVAVDIVRDRSRSILADAGRACAGIYFDRFTAYAVDKSRVIVIEFQSRDPELAARVATRSRRLPGGAAGRAAGAGQVGRTMAVRRNRQSAQEGCGSRIPRRGFSLEIEPVRRHQHTTLSNQQMGELNTQLNNARALKSDAESKARLIREMLQSGKPIEASEVLNSELTAGCPNSALRCAPSLPSSHRRCSTTIRASRS